jgi:XTP/dITP diphosphohydrolase
MRIQEKAAAVGFDWEHREQVWSKVEEEMQELSQVVQDSGVLDRNRAEDEFGDLMFALVNYARFLKISPEDALERTNRKFMSRFTYIESKARQRGVEMDTLTLEQMDDLWNEAKRLEAK